MCCRGECRGQPGQCVSSGTYLLLPEKVSSPFKNILAFFFFIFKLLRGKIWTEEIRKRYPRLVETKSNNFYQVLSFLLTNIGLYAFVLFLLSFLLLKSEFHAFFPTFLLGCYSIWGLKTFLGLINHLLYKSRQSMLRSIETRYNRFYGIWYSTWRLSYFFFNNGLNALGVKKKLLHLFFISGRAV